MAYTDKRGYKREHSNAVHRNRAYSVYLKNRKKYPLPFSAYEVHHIDGDKTNNRMDNLAILTPEEHDKEHDILDFKKTIFFQSGLSIQEYTKKTLDLEKRYKIKAGKIDEIFHNNFTKILDRTKRWIIAKGNDIGGISYFFDSKTGGIYDEYQLYTKRKSYIEVWENVEEELDKIEEEREHEKAMKEREIKEKQEREARKKKRKENMDKARGWVKGKLKRKPEEPKEKPEEPKEKPEVKKKYICSDCGRGMPWQGNGRCKICNTKRKKKREGKQRKPRRSSGRRQRRRRR